MWRREHAQLKQNKAFPATGLLTEKEKETGQSQGLMEPIPTRNSQNLTNIFFDLLRVVTNFPGSHELLINYPTAYCLRERYVPIWGGYKLPPRLGFCFKSLARMCLMEKSSSRTAAPQSVVGF